jgi:hypothetical protein
MHRGAVRVGPVKAEHLHLVADLVGAGHLLGKGMSAWAALRSSSMRSVMGEPPLTSAVIMRHPVSIGVIAAIWLPP